MRCHRAMLSPVASRPAMRCLSSLVDPPSFIRQSTFDNRQFLLPNTAALRKCHRMTLHEKNVLAERTHLTVIAHKTKQKCCRSRRSSPGRLPSGFGRVRSLAFAAQRRVNTSRDPRV